MTTAIAIDPAAELKELVEERDGVGPVVTVAGDTALASYRFANEVRTDIWVLREDGWKLLAVNHSIG
jgi:hypothetical protein